MDVTDPDWKKRPSSTCPRPVAPALEQSWPRGRTTHASRDNARASMRGLDSRTLILAVDDAEDLVKKGRTLAKAAELAARRAPALALAPLVLRSITNSDARETELIPAALRTAVVDSKTHDDVEPNVTPDMIEKMKRWLTANPWELRKALSNRRALLSASQAILTVTLGTFNQGTFKASLEAQVLAQLKERIASSTKPKLVNIRKARGWPVSFAAGYEDVRSAALASLPTAITGPALVTVTTSYSSLLLTLKLPRAALADIGDPEGEATSDAAFNAAEAVILEKERAVDAERAAAAVAWAAERDASRRMRGVRVAAGRERRCVLRHQDTEDELSRFEPGGRSRCTRDGRKRLPRHRAPKCSRQRQILAAAEHEQGLLVGRQTRAVRAAEAERLKRRRVRLRTQDRARARGLKYYTA